MNRGNAFLTEIIDPDNPNDKSAIKDMLVIDGELYIFKETCIFKARTADNIDPDRLYDNTKHTYEKIYDIGTDSIYVSRSIIQFKSIIEGIPFIDENYKDSLLKEIWSASKLLFSCQGLFSSLMNQVIRKMAVCDEIINKHKGKPVIPALPKIIDLDVICERFFLDAKKYLINIYELISLFSGVKIKSGADFAHMNNELSKSLGKGHEIVKILNEDFNFIRQISCFRNAIEHRRVGNKVEFQNIFMMPDNKFSNPSWKWDLTEKLEVKQEYFSDIIVDMGGILQDMLFMFEDFCAVCIESFILDKLPFMSIKQSSGFVSKESSLIRFQVDFDIKK